MDDPLKDYNLPPHLGISQCRHGLMMYLKKDWFIGQSLEVYGEFCEAEIQLFEQLLKPGMVAIDVGANIGSHSIPMAKLIGPSGVLHVFEPQRALYQILCANIALNGLFNVYTHNVGLGAVSGSLNVPATDYTSNLNFAGIDLTTEQGEPVKVHTLDSYDLEKLDFLKLDVEGMESKALEGAVKTIARHRPLMFVENDRPENSEQLISFIMSLGYRLWWHISVAFNPYNFRGETENYYTNGVSNNMLCIPKEHNVTVPFPEILDPKQTILEAVQIAFQAAG